MTNPQDYVWIGPVFFGTKLAIALFMDWMQKEKMNG